MTNVSNLDPHALSNAAIAHNWSRAIFVTYLYDYFVRTSIRPDSLFYGAPLPCRPNSLRAKGVAPDSVVYLRGTKIPILTLFPGKYAPVNPELR